MGVFSALFFFPKVFFFKQNESLRCLIRWNECSGRLEGVGDPARRLFTILALSGLVEVGSPNSAQGYPNEPCILLPFFLFMTLA
jgi:hypothetical protein